MKITKNKLKQIIKEEVKSVIRESMSDAETDILRKAQKAADDVVNSFGRPIDIEDDAAIWDAAMAVKGSFLPEESEEWEKMWTQYGSHENDLLEYIADWIVEGIIANNIQRNNNGTRSPSRFNH